MRLTLLHWLAMAAILVAILCCAAVLWGRRAPRLFHLPILRDPDLRMLLLVIFGLPLLVPIGHVRLMSGVILAALMVAALAVLTWRVGLRLAAVGGLVATGVLWGVWTNRLTADILAIALILAVLNLTIQLSRNFWTWSWFGIANVGYDIVTTYVVDTQTGGAQYAVAHASPSVLVVFSHYIGTLDVAIPGAIIMVAATVAYRHRRWVILSGGLTGYLAGFAACEAVAQLTDRGVAAMMTLVPATMAGILLPAWRTGLLRQLSPQPGQATDSRPAPTQTIPSRREPL